MLSQKLSIEQKILSLLLEPTHYYKGVPITRLGLPALLNCKKQSVSNAIYRLNKGGMVSQKENYLSLLPRGKKYIENKKARLMTFDSTFSKDDKKDLLVMFDIPESQKAEREWFRFHLRKFGYIMIQRSVWVGPSPLPREFMNYVKQIRLEECLKTFKLAKGYTQNKR